MELINIIFIISIPVLAIVLSVIFTNGDKIHMRFFKLIGVIVSSMPIIGFIQGFIAKNRSPTYSKACFSQAIYCGLGYVFIHKVLPNYI